MDLSSFIWGSPASGSPASIDFKDVLDISDQLVAAVQDIDLRRVTFMTPSRDIPPRIKKFRTQIETIEKSFVECKEKCQTKAAAIGDITKKQIEDYTKLQLKFTYLQRRLCDLQRWFQNSDFERKLVAYQKNIKDLYANFTDYSKFEWTCSLSIEILRNECPEPQRHILAQCMIHLAAYAEKKWQASHQQERLQGIQKEAKVYLCPKKTFDVQDKDQELIDEFEILSIGDHVPLQPRFAFKVEEYAFSKRFGAIYQQAMEIQKTARIIQANGINLEAEQLTRLIDDLDKEQAKILSSDQIHTLQVIEALQYAQALKEYLYSLGKNLTTFQNITNLQFYCCNLLDSSDEKQKLLLYFNIQTSPSVTQNRMELFKKVGQNRLYAPLFADNEQISQIFLECLFLPKTEPLPKKIQIDMVSRMCRALFVTQEADPIVDLFGTKFQHQMKKDSDVSRICDKYISKYGVFHRSRVIEASAVLLDSLSLFSHGNLPKNCIVHAHSMVLMKQIAKKAEGPLVPILRFCVLQMNREMGIPTLEQRFQEFHDKLAMSLWGEESLLTFCVDTKPYLLQGGHLPDQLVYLLDEYILDKWFSTQTLFEHEKQALKKIFIEYVSKPDKAALYSTFHERAWLEAELYKLLADREVAAVVKQFRD